jgi:signal transduction histidine kinase
VGVIYPSEPADGKLPSPEAIETIEVFVSLCEVAIENARLTVEREHALRVSNQRTEQLSRILDLATGIMYVRDLDQMLDGLLKTLARLLGMKRMVIGVKHEAEGVYKVEAVYGYSGKATEAIKALPYSIEKVDSVLDSSDSLPIAAAIKWSKKVGRMTYYMPAESQNAFPTKEEMAYFPDIEILREPRRGKGYWHDLDWMDTYISDKTGKPIAYLEILKPRDDRTPDSETIEVIEVFATLAGIAIENSRLLQEQIDSRRNAELYTDVLSHDIKNFNQAILGYLDMLRLTADKPEARVLLSKISEQVMNTNWLASNVRTMSRVTFGEVELSRRDLGAVLLQCERNMIQYFPGRKISIKTDFEKSQMFTSADDLVWELFTNVLTNSVKYDSHDEVEIEIKVERRSDGGKRYWLVSIADHGRGIPDETKSIVFDRFSRAPQKKGSGMGMHIVKTLATRYGGKVWVEDREEGDHTKGTVVRVQLPAID